ncbi:hypothetical protein B0H19DRAFT_1380786 [Mycena capillaripes]|nr:hypothetical protein B0H19DRAFT_1380786 [Mycena capillaripes]
MHHPRPPSVVEWYLRRLKTIAHDPPPDRKEEDDPELLAALKALNQPPFPRAPSQNPKPKPDPRVAARKDLIKKLLSIFARSENYHPLSASDPPRRLEDIVEVIARHPEWSSLVCSIARGDSTRMPELWALMNDEPLASLCHSYYLYLEHVAEYPELHKHFDKAKTSKKK